MIRIKNVSVVELRRLLYDLMEKTDDTCVRVRLIGEMWQPGFCRILKLSQDGVVLCDEQANKLYFIRDLRNVVQFEIDKPFQTFQPHHHYHVDSPALI